MISSNIVTENIAGTSVGEMWNITPTEYRMTVDGKSQKVDFQDLMVFVSEQRALVVEAEVAPLSTRIQKRNDKLVAYGKALSSLAAFSAKFDTSKSNPSASAKVDQTLHDVLYEVMGWNWATGDSREHSKADVDNATQAIKTQVEKMNNDAQLNMSRLQTLVSHRDQSFNTATTLMTHISDTRGNTIKSIM